MTFRWAASPGELDRWLERVLAGEDSPEPSVRAALGVLGLRWRATADRDAPAAGPDRPEDPDQQMSEPDRAEDPDQQMAEPDRAEDPDEQMARPEDLGGEVPEPDRPAPAEIPGPPGLDGGQRDALAGLGLAEKLVGADGDCLMNALLISAPEVFSGWDAAGLREYLAWFLDDQIGRNGPAWQEMKVNALWSLAMDQAAREPNLPQSEVDRYVADYSVNPPAGWQADLVQGLARVGEWGHVSADLAPALAAAAFDLGLMIVYPGGGVQPFRDGGHRAALVRVPGHWHGTRPLEGPDPGQDPVLPLGSPRAPSSAGDSLADAPDLDWPAGGGDAGDGASGPDEELSPGAMIAVLLEAERDAWLAWDTEALDLARQATNQFLQVRHPDAAAAEWEHFRAVIEFWRENGHLEVPQRRPGGNWLSDIRKERVPYWARPALGVLGLPWRGAYGKGRTVRPWEVLPAQLRAEDEARRRGESDAVVTAAGQVDSGLAGNHPEIVLLRAAVARWRASRTVDLPPGHPADGELDQWLEDVRDGRVSVPSWLRAALGVLGIRWPRGADRARVPGVLQAERAARLTGNPEVFEAAREATDEALADQPRESKLDAQSPGQPAGGRPVLAENRAPGSTEESCRGSGRAAGASRRLAAQHPPGEGDRE